VLKRGVIVLFGAIMGPDACIYGNQYGYRLDILLRCDVYSINTFYRALGSNPEGQDCPAWI
jgi:hypothetical protein